MKSKAARVLIVDDMPVNRMILSSMLAAQCVVSDQVESGAECLNLCEKREYDLILLDHRMPELDGVDTFLKLREIFGKRGREIPVICHTTEEGRNNINLYRAAGFADVLIKPIDPEQISEIVMQYLPQEEYPDAEEASVAARTSGISAVAAVEDDMRDEIEKLPLWLKTVPHIDLVAGITNCETAEDYLDALYIFHASIKDKASDIIGYLESRNYEGYRLCVHSLKSMARLTGIRTVSAYAASLEEAAKKEDYRTLKEDTRKLVDAYRGFMSLLSPLSEDEELKNRHSDAHREEIPETAVRDRTRTVLFVRAEQNVFTRGIETILQSAGYQVIPVMDEPDVIIEHRYDADLILYYPVPCAHSHTGLTVNLLGEICQDDDKILCVMGNAEDVKEAMSAKWSHRISRSYVRPVNRDGLIRDMDLFAGLLKEYQRKKTIFVAEDDPDYRSLIEKWLSPAYHVSGFASGRDLLQGLSAATPELVLLDYEMPHMDGYEVLMHIRKNSPSGHVPVIFLTGKNDREHVVRILEFKPDGYLLKSSSKEAIVDRISSFFSEVLFRRSQVTT